MNSVRVFTGNGVAKIVSLSLAALLVVGILLLADQAFPSYITEEGVVEKFWYQSGSITYGTVSTPKPNEPGAQSFVITASPGKWLLEIRTLSGVEVVECDRKPDLSGEKVFYRRKVGAILGRVSGTPVCA